MENFMLPDRKWALKPSSEGGQNCFYYVFVEIVCVWHVFSHTHFISEHWFPTEPHMSEMCLCVWTLHKAALRLSLDNLLSCQLLYMTHFLSCFHLFHPCYRPLQDVHATTCHESWLFALCNGYWNTFISKHFFLIVHTKMKSLSSFTHPPAVPGVSDFLVFSVAQKEMVWRILMLLFSISWFKSTTKVVHKTCVLYSKSFWSHTITWAYKQTLIL